MLENILGNIELRKLNLKFILAQNDLLCKKLTRPAWAGFTTAEEGRTKIM